MISVFHKFFMLEKALTEILLDDLLEITFLASVLIPAFWKIIWIQSRWRNSLIWGKDGKVTWESNFIMVLQSQTCVSSQFKLMCSIPKQLCPNVVLSVSDLPHWLKNGSCFKKSAFTDHIFLIGHDANYFNESNTFKLHVKNSLWIGRDK